MKTTMKETITRIREYSLSAEEIEEILINHIGEQNALLQWDECTYGINGCTITATETIEV